MTRVPLRISKKIIGIVLLLSLIGGFAAFGIMALPRDDIGFSERVLYGIWGKTFFSDVYLKYPDGGVRKLSPTENGIYYQAHINRNGTKVVFYGNDLGSPRIWLTDLDKQTTRPLTPENMSARHPSFSWDGTMIAFSSDAGIAQERERIELMHGDGRPPKNHFLNIYIMDTEGRNLRQITKGPYADQRPAFSPDGKMIAFVSNRDGIERVWTVSLNGREEPVPLQNEGFGYRPCYSPDGGKIYFFTKNNNSDQLGFINISDKKISLLNDFGKGNEHGPFVGYDGKNLLLHSNRSGKWEIWELSLTGQELRKIEVPFDEALHATRSANGIIAFDVPKISEVRKILSEIKMTIK